VINNYYEVGDRFPGSLPAWLRRHRIKRLGSPYRSGSTTHWIKVKNPKAPAVKREAEEEWA
jgi:hypothetical protein